MDYTVTHDIVDTNTGEKLAPVQLDGWDYQTVLNGVGRGTAACRLRGQGLTRADWRDLMRPWKRTLVHSINGFAMYAGTLTGSKWNPRTGLLNVTSAEVRAFAARRYPFMVPTFNPNAVTRFEGQTLAGIARSVLQLGFHSTPGDNWHIPLVLGPTRPGTRAMEWAWEDFPRIENMLTEVTNLNGGPDIYLDPLWSTAGRLEWWARYGTPDIAGGIIESRVGPGTNLDGLEVTTDAARQVSGVFALGSGSGMDRRIGRAGSEHLLAAGYPVTPQIPDMDMETSWDAVEDTATLDALALGDLRARRQETEVWSFNLAMDGTFAPHELKPGATVRAFHPGDEWLPEGWHDEYVMSVSGGPSSTLRVGVRTSEQQG